MVQYNIQNTHTLPRIYNSLDKLVYKLEDDTENLLLYVYSLPDIVQSDWNTEDTTDMSYIKNKPDVPILESGLIPERYLPSYVDDIIEGYYYNNAFYKDSVHTQIITGETGKIYVDLSTDLTYRWSGSIYVEIAKSIITGVKGNAEQNYRTGNVNITAANIGLDNVVNIDLSKAIKGITRNGTTFTYTCLDGTTGTFDQQDNNTTYSAGTGLQLTNTAFSVKLGYTTSGNNRAVQADTNGNLYVTLKDDNTWTAWKGATASADGTAGYMPAPTKAQYLLFLRGDGTWVSLNNYSLPLAANGTRGGILIGYTQSGKNYPVLLSSEKAYVNVPWTDTTYSAGTGMSLSGTTFNCDYAPKVLGSYTSNGGQQNPNYFGKNRVGFLMMNTTVNSNTLYKDWLIMDCYSGSDVGGGVAIGVNRLSLGAYIMRSAAARTSWAESAELCGTHNSSVSLSGSTLTVKIAGVEKSLTNTWRGILNNLTSTSTTDSLSAYQGYLLANGSARDNTKLPLTGGTISNGSSWATIGFSRTGTGSGSVGGIDGNGLYFSHINSDGSKSINMYLKAGDGLRVGGNLVWNSGNDGSGSGLDADLLDGAHASYFVGGKLYGSKELTTKQWYRILDVVTHPTSFLLTFGPTYNNNEPTSVTFLILHSYNHVNILQIGAAPVGGAISEVRAIFHDTFKMYIEFYYNLASNLKNTVRYTVIPLTEITRGNISLVDFTTGSGTAAASCTTSTLVRSDISYRLSHSALTEDNCVPTNYDSMQSFRCTTSTTGYNDGYILAWRYSSGNYVSLLFADVDATYGLCYRYRASNGTWGSWKKVAFTSDLSSYLPLSGGTITGALILTASSSPSRLRITSVNSSGAGVIDFTEDTGGNTLHFQILDKLGTGISADSRFLNFWVKGYGSAISIKQDTANPVVGIGGGDSLSTAGTYKLYVFGSSYGTAWNTGSDQRLKDIIGDKTITLESIANAPLIRYKWKGDGKDENVHVGSIAQYWNSIIPEAVTTASDTYMSMQYDIIATASSITLARELIKQKERIAELEKEIEILKEILNNNL